MRVRVCIYIHMHTTHTHLSIVILVTVIEKGSWMVLMGFNGQLGQMIKKWHWGTSFQDTGIIEEEEVRERF